MRHFAQSVTGMGLVIDSDPENYAFTILVRSGDTFQCFVNEETQFSVLRNLDGQNPDRFAPPRASKHRPGFSVGANGPARALNSSPQRGK